MHGRRRQAKKGEMGMKMCKKAGASAENGNADCRGRAMITNSPIVPHHL